MSILDHKTIYIISPALFENYHMHAEKDYWWHYFYEWIDNRYQQTFMHYIKKEGGASSLEPKIKTIFQCKCALNILFATDTNCTILIMPTTRYLK